MHRTDRDDRGDDQAPLTSLSPTEPQGARPRRRARADWEQPTIADHAAIGDGRAVALVCRDGTVDWLPFPDIDSPSVFGAILDPGRGGRFELSPTAPFEVTRRYVADTNVLETTFTTDTGAARITDAMTLPAGGLSPFRELARRIEGVSGSVTLDWRVEPRFGYGLDPTRIGRRAGVPVATAGADAIAVRSWQAGEPALDAGGVRGRFETSPGSRSLIALSGSHQEPLVFPTRGEVERRLDHTIEWWRAWTGDRACSGPWREALTRSALVLQLMVSAPYGSVAAAPTTSLPEEIGGVRNWDYRYGWVRDSAFAMNTFLELGCQEQAEAFFWWLMHASQLTHPRLNALYRMDGGTRAPERTLPLDGHRGSRPVRIGNGAIEQLQLDIYGDLLHMAWLYADAGRRIDRELGRRLAEVADLVCEIWDEPDSGMWEVRDGRRHFTQSKMMCAVALDRASLLARIGQIPPGNADWNGSAAMIRDFVERRCWSKEKRSYVRSAGSEELDASVLLGVVFGYADPGGTRFASTIEAVQEALSDGPLLRRYVAGDGVAGGEGAFLACSFWLVEALSRSGRTDDAADLMDQLVQLANDVGLYAEEIDPATGEFLGNFPQALTHLALISAAAALRERDPGG